jgi:hypothetical protein
MHAHHAAVDQGQQVGLPRPAAICRSASLALGVGDLDRIVDRARDEADIALEVEQRAGIAPCSPQEACAAPCSDAQRLDIALRALNATEAELRPGGAIGLARRQRRRPGQRGAIVAQARSRRRDTCRPGRSAIRTFVLAAFRSSAA